MLLNVSIHDDGWTLFNNDNNDNNANNNNNKSNNGNNNA
jgi:hypothetical protein